MTSISPTIAAAIQRRRRFSRWAPILYVVSKLLGHSSIQMTEVYAKIVDQKKVETMNLVNNLFTNPAANPEAQTANAI